MPRKFSEQFIDRLLSDVTEGSMAELSSILCGSAQFHVESPDYGFPVGLFVFCEVLLWISQTERSGSYTYFDATPVSRQKILIDALESLRAHDLARTYRRGMANVDDSETNRWVNENGTAVRNWLRSLSISQRDEILRLTS
jgi:hypothetical protein